MHICALFHEDGGDRNSRGQGPNLTIMRKRLASGWTGAHPPVTSAARQGRLLRAPHDKYELAAVIHVSQHSKVLDLILVVM